MDSLPQRADARPQYLRTHRQVLDATEALLAEEGLWSVTIERIASRSGASTATIYRHWPAKIAIIAEAFGRRVHRALSVPDTGDPLQDLVELSVDSMLFHSTDGAEVFFDLLAACRREPEGAAYLQQYYLGPRRKVSQVLFERAQAEGLLRPELDPELGLDLLFGAAVFRALRLPGQVDRHQLHTIITLALTGLLTPGTEPEKGRAHDNAR